ncbi:unnamed protein product, partial [Mesorhabditis spiculigera]
MSRSDLPAPHPNPLVDQEPGPSGLRYYKDDSEKKKREAQAARKDNIKDMRKLYDAIHAGEDIYQNPEMLQRLQKFKQVQAGVKKTLQQLDLSVKEESTTNKMT